MRVKCHFLRSLPWGGADVSPPLCHSFLWINFYLKFFYKLHMNRQWKTTSNKIEIQKNTDINHHPPYLTYDNKCIYIILTIILFWNSSGLLVFVHNTCISQETFRYSWIYGTIVILIQKIVKTVKKSQKCFVFFSFRDEIFAAIFLLLMRCVCVCVCVCVLNITQRFHSHIKLKGRTQIK